MAGPMTDREASAANAAAACVKAEIEAEAEAAEGAARGMGEMSQALLLSAARHQLRTAIMLLNTVETVLSRVLEDDDVVKKP